MMQRRLSVRIISLFLSFAMIGSYFPETVLASELPDNPTEITAENMNEDSEASDEGSEVSDAADDELQTQYESEGPSEEVMEDEEHDGFDNMNDGGTSGNITWYVDDDCCLHIEGTGDYEIEYEDFVGYRAPWYHCYCTSAKISLSGSTSLRRLLVGYHALKSVDLSELDTSSVTDMSGMFNLCPSLTSLNVSGFDTSSVTDMSEMFYGCSSLTSLDTSGFDTGNVTDMSGMFNGCSSLTSLDTSGFDTSSVTDMSGMFIGCSSLTSLNVSGFDTSSVTDMGNMFGDQWFEKGGCRLLTDLDVSGFDTSNVTNMNWMFGDCSSLTNLDVSGFDTSSLTDMTGLFCGCSSLTSLDVSGFDTENVIYMNSMFGNCSSLTSLNVSGFDTKNVRGMNQMFGGCSGLTSLNVSGFDTSSLTEMVGMFNGCSGLTSLDVSCFNNIPMLYISSMFNGCSGLTSLDVSGFDTSNTILMGSLFSGCSGLTSLDVSNFDTSRATYMDGMFNGCSGLKSLDLSSFDTSNVQYMEWMFKDCSSLTSLDVGSFDTSSVKDVRGMFHGCSSLKGLDLSSFDLSKARETDDFFRDCASLKMIRTPKIGRNVGLPFTRENSWTAIQYGTWTDSDGNEYYGLPSLGYSITLSMNGQFELYDWIVEDGVLTISGMGPVEEYAQYPWSQPPLNEQIRSIVIGDGITSLPKDCFSGLKKYKSITIPTSVRSIHSTALGRSGNSLSTIHYMGTQTNWENRLSDDLLGILKDNAIAVHFAGMDPNLYKGWFRYITYEGGAVSAPYTYECDFDWFFSPSNVGTDDKQYSHGLATMSMKVAMAAFAGTYDNYVPTVKEREEDLRNYENDRGVELGSRNIRKMMDALGFEYDLNSIHYAPSVDLRDMNKIGCAIGKKTIEKGDKKCTLVLCAIRGAGYQDEWGGNMYVGKEETAHSGFEAAAEDVKRYLENYIDKVSDEIPPDEEIKVWLVGYSRAGAVANLTAAKLDDGGIGAVKRENVYAYCFECPQNTTASDAGADKYRNIVNIINPIDLIPRVAPSEDNWSFSRYGVTYELPSPTNTTKKYKTFHDAMKLKLWKILGYQNVRQRDELDKLIDESLYQEFAFDGLIRAVAGLTKSRKYYAENLQEKTILAIIRHMTEKKIRIGKEEIDVSVGGLLLADLYDIIMIRSGRNRIEALTDLVKILDGLAYVKSSLEVDFIRNGHPLTYWADRISISHYPELNLAWMEAVGGKVIYIEDLLRNKGYRIVLVNCPVDVTVRDGSGNIVGEIVDDEPQQNDSGILTFMDQNGQKGVLLPMNADYSVEMVGTADGDVTYSVTDIFSGTGTADRLVCYEEVGIEKGEMLTASVEETIEDEADYTLTREDGTQEQPTIELDGAQISGKHIEVVTNGNGQADNGGDYLPGQFVKLSAEPDDQAIFLGWYDENDELLCCDEEYRFLVKDDVSLAAEFSDDAPDRYSVLFNATGGNGSSVLRNAPENSLITLPDDPVREGYTFRGWYTKKDGMGTRITERTKIRENLVLYAYWIKDECRITFATDRFAFYADVEDQVTGIAPMTAAGGETCDLPDPDPIEDYSFGGWFTKEDGAGIRYTDDTPVLDDVTLYPYWRHVGFSVSPIPDQVYTGKEIKPEIKVYDGTKLLTPDVDYKITKYANNKTAAGSDSDKPPTLTVSGKGNYTGTDTVTFSIVKKDIGDADVVAGDIILNYNKGKALAVKPVITYNGKALTNKEYSFEIFRSDTDEEGNALGTFTKVTAVSDAGSYKITATGMGNFSGTRDISLKVADLKPFKNASISKIDNSGYTGEEICPEITVKYKNEILGKDAYTVSYSDNIEIGTATVTVTGKEEAGYTGSKTATFKITGTSISGAIVKNADGSAFTAAYVYRGSYIRPAVTVDLKIKGAVTRLTKGTDYSVAYTDNREPGTAAVTITGRGRYFGTVKKTFKIKPYSIKTDPEGLIEICGAPVVNGITDFAAGSEISVPYFKDGAVIPGFTVTYNGRTLKPGEEYTVSYKNNKKPAGLSDKQAPTATVKGKGRFEGAADIRYTITPQSIANVTMTAEDTAYSTKKNGFKTTVTLTDQGKVLAQKTDYDSVVYTYAADMADEGGNIVRHAGEIVKDADIVPADTQLTVTVTGKGGYGALDPDGKPYKKSQTFTVRKKSIAKAKVTIQPQDYTGSSITLGERDIKVVLDGESLVLGRDYKIEYSNNINKGSSAKAVIKGMGNYSGSVSKAFTIKEKRVSWWWNP